MVFAKGHACACPFALGSDEPQSKSHCSMHAHGRRGWCDVVPSRRHLEILAGLDISGTPDDSDGGGVHLFLRARSTAGGAQAAGQRKNWRAETDYEIREADFHCRFPASGFRFPVWMVAQNFRCGARLAHDLFGSDCACGILDDVLGHGARTATLRGSYKWKKINASSLSGLTGSFDIRCISAG